MTLAGVIGASLPFLFFTDEDFAERGKPLPTKPTRRKIEHCPLEGLESRGIQLKAKDGNLSYDRSSMEALVAEVMKEVGYQETVKIIIGLDTDQEFAETWLFFMLSVTSSENGIRAYPLLKTVAWTGTVPSSSPSVSSRFSNRASSRP